MEIYRKLSLKTFCLFLTATLLAFVSETNAEEPAETQLSVLITGANRGLGLEFAKQFGEKGYHVIGTARSPEKATELKDTGAEVMKLDVTSEEDIAALAEALKGKKLDILINNAGYFGPTLSVGKNTAKINNITRQEMIDCFTVNTMGPIFVSQALLPSLKLSKFPKIINISTRSSQLSTDRSKAWGYGVSKAGLNMVTNNLHGELFKQGFIVISLAPGHNQTDMGNGDLEPVESIGKMIPLIENLTKEKSGRFWFYNGKELPW
ncbi:SDR family oxidoreductase [Luteolibacter sp. AS25]|uniref:SDR family oxidoreductase n=1 Tax=Luteolibacter sp. AS25 TaxID=3135776 RepID=UPI00398BB64B